MRRAMERGRLMFCAASSFERLDDVKTTVGPRGMMAGAKETALLKCGLH